jgi:hypothetical protein
MQASHANGVPIGAASPPRSANIRQTGYGL